MAGGEAPVVLGDQNPEDTTVDAGLTTPATLRQAAPAEPARAVPPDARLASTGGVAPSVPLAGLVLVAGGLGCLAVARRSSQR